MQKVITQPLCLDENINVKHKQALGPLFRSPPLFVKQIVQYFFLLLSFVLQLITLWVMFLVLLYHSMFDIFVNKSAGKKYIYIKKHAVCETCFGEAWAAASSRLR